MSKKVLDFNFLGSLAVAGVATFTVEANQITW